MKTQEGDRGGRTSGGTERKSRRENKGGVVKKREVVGRTKEEYFSFMRIKL